MVRVRLLACLLVLLVLLPAASARGDDPPTYADRPDGEALDAERSFGFLVNPLATAFGVFGGEADFVLGRYAAIALEGGLYLHGDVPGVALGTGMLVYPLGTVLQRLYVEPRIAYARPVSESFAALDWTVEVIGLGATAGWQWTWEYGFSVRLGAGAMDFVGGSRHGPANGSLALGPQAVLDGSLGWTF